MSSKSIKKPDPIINPVERKTNEEIDTADDGSLIIGGEKESTTEGDNSDHFEGIED